MTHGKTQTLTRILDKLCALFDEELERQNSVLEMCVAQGKAARSSDFEELEARTDGLVVLMEAALQAEKRRIEVFGWLVRHYGMPESAQTLSELIAIVPQPWRNRMTSFQRDVKKTLERTQDVVAWNETFMTKASEVLDDSIKEAVGHVSLKPDGYGATGMEAKMQQQPALLNTIG